MKESDEIFMKRAIALARIPSADVRTNPNVGAVLVHNGRIIGEGNHNNFGGSHAEVNAVNSVAESDQRLIEDSTLYVTLEPCNFHGKTPPCSTFILDHNIKTLVIGCEDPNPKIAGSSLAFLEQKGVQVTKNILKKECETLIAPFRVNILENRPYITIKFAQSKDFYISKKGSQTWISNHYSKVFSHKLRATNNAILIGTNTAIIDDPALTNRLFSGSTPLRVVLDRRNKIPLENEIFTDDLPLLLINEETRAVELKESKEQWKVDFNEKVLEQLMERLYKEKDIGRIIIEGGAATINGFIACQLWDQAMVITSPVRLNEGIKAPNIEGRLTDVIMLGNDKLNTISRLA